MPFVFKDGATVEIPQEELDAIQFQSVETKELLVRVKRDSLMASTDWWATSDRTMTAEQTAYRQALRDITNQEGFPANVTWPQEPSA